MIIKQLKISQPTNFQNLILNHCKIFGCIVEGLRNQGIDQELCIKCGECVAACPPQYDAVRKVSPPNLAPRVEPPVKPPKE